MYLIYERRKEQARVIVMSLKVLAIVFGRL